MIPKSGEKIRLHGRHDVTAKKEVRINVLGMRSTKLVHSFEAERELLLAAAVWEEALGKSNGLPPLAHEVLMCPALGMSGGQCNVPEDLLRAPRAAREFARQFLEKRAPTSFDDVVNIMRGQWESLLTLDRGMAIEQSLLENAEGTFDENFTQAVLKLLPDEHTAVCIDNAHAQVCALKEGELHKFCSKKA